MGLLDNLFTNKKEKAAKTDRSRRPAPNVSRAPARPPPYPPNTTRSEEQPAPSSTFGSLRRLKGKVATSTPKKPSTFYADLEKTNSKRENKDLLEGSKKTTVVDNNGNFAPTGSDTLDAPVVKSGGKENVKRPESKKIVPSSSRPVGLSREVKAKSSTLSLQNILRLPPKNPQISTSKPKRPVTIASSSNISTRRGHKEGQSHPDNLSRTSSITNLDSLEANLQGQQQPQGKGAKPRKAASKERIDKQGQDGKKVTKNNNKLEPPAPPTGQPLSYSSDSLQEAELHQLRKQLRDMADEKSSLALQLGEQRGQLNVLQKEILKLKSFQEESNLEMEKLSEENTALRNRLRDVAHSPLSDNEKQQLLFESRHHSSAPASIATNVIDDNGGDTTACTTPDWDKHSSGNVSEVSVACLQDKINQMQETHYSTNEELQATLQELTDLQRQLTELQQENERLNEEKSLMFDSLCRQTERLNDSRQEVENLKQLLYRDRSDETGINQFESAVEREQKLVEVLRSAQEEREQLLLKLEQVQAELHDTRTGNAEKSENISQLTERVRTLECTLDAKHAEHKQLDQELAQAKDQCSGKQIEINRLSDLLETARTKINELEQDRALGDKSELDELLDNARKEKDQLESEVTYLKEQLARSKNEIEKLKEQVFVLQEECKVTRNNAKTTQSDLEYKCEKLLAEKTAIGEQLQQFQEGVNELQVQAQCHLEDKRQLSAVLSETQRNLSEAERKNLNLESEIQELRKLRAEENDEWEKFQNDLLTSVRVANDFKTEAQQELQKIILENKTYRERVRLLEGQLEKLKGEKTTTSTQTDVILTPQIISLAKNLDPALTNRISLASQEFRNSHSPTENMERLFPILSRERKSKSKDNLTDIDGAGGKSNLKKSKSKDDLKSYENENKGFLKRGKSKDNLQSTTEPDHKEKGSRGFLRWNKSKENLEIHSSDENATKEKRNFFKRNKSQENLEQFPTTTAPLSSDESHSKSLDKPRKSTGSSSDSNHSDPKPEFFSKFIKKREKKPVNRVKATSHPKFMSVEEEILLKSLDSWYQNIDHSIPDELLSEQDRAIRKLKILYEDDMMKEKPVAHKPKEHLAISKPLLNSVVSNPKLEQIYRDPKLHTVDVEIRQSALEDVSSVINEDTNTVDGGGKVHKHDDVYTNIGPPHLGIHKSDNLEDVNVFEEYRTESELAPVMYRAVEAKHYKTQEHYATRDTVFSDVQPCDSISNPRYSSQNDLPKPNIYINYENLDQIVARIPKDVAESKLTEQDKFALKLKQALDDAEKQTTLKKMKKKHKSIRGLEISLPTLESVQTNWKLKEIILNPGIKRAKAPKMIKAHEDAWKRHSTDISSDVGSPHEASKNEFAQSSSKSYEDISFSFVPENTLLNLYYGDKIRASKYYCDTTSSSSQSFTSAEFNLDTGKIMPKCAVPAELTQKIEEDLLYNETINKAKKKEAKEKRLSKEAVLAQLKIELHQQEKNKEEDIHHPRIKGVRDSYKNDLKDILRRMEHDELRRSLRKQRMDASSDDLKEDGNESSSQFIRQERLFSDGLEQTFTRTEFRVISSDEGNQYQFADFENYRRSLEIQEPKYGDVKTSSANEDTEHQLDNSKGPRSEQPLLFKGSAILDSGFGVEPRIEAKLYHKFDDEGFINEAPKLHDSTPKEAQRVVETLNFHVPTTRHYQETLDIGRERAEIEHIPELQFTHLGPPPQLDLKATHKSEMPEFGHLGPLSIHQHLTERVHNRIDEIQAGPELKNVHVEMPPKKHNVEALTIEETTHLRPLSPEELEKNIENMTMIKSEDVVSPPTHLIDDIAPPPLGFETLPVEITTVAPELKFTHQEPPELPESVSIQLEQRKQINASHFEPPLHHKTESTTLSEFGILHLGPSPMVAQIEIATITPELRLTHKEPALHQEATIAPPLPESVSDYLGPPSPQQIPDLPKVAPPPLNFEAPLDLKIETTSITEFKTSHLGPPPPNSTGAAELSLSLTPQLVTTNLEQSPTDAEIDYSAPPSLPEPESTRLEPSLHQKIESILPPKSKHRGPPASNTTFTTELEVIHLGPPSYNPDLNEEKYDYTFPGLFSRSPHPIPPHSEVDVVSVTPQPPAKHLQRHVLESLPQEFTVDSELHEINTLHETTLATPDLKQAEAKFEIKPEFTHLGSPPSTPDSYRKGFETNSPTIPPDFAHFGPPPSQIDEQPLNQEEFKTYEVDSVTPQVAKLTKDYGYTQTLKENQYGVVSPLNLRYTYRSVVKEYKNKFPPEEPSGSERNSTKSDMEYTDDLIDEYFKPLEDFESDFDGPTIEEIDIDKAEDKNVVARNPDAISQIDKEMYDIMDTYLHTRASLLVQKMDERIDSRKSQLGQRSGLKKYENVENLQEITDGDDPVEGLQIAQPAIVVESDDNISQTDDDDDEPLSLQDLQFIEEMKAKYASVDTISTISDKSIEEQEEVNDGSHLTVVIPRPPKYRKSLQRPLSDINERDLQLIEEISRRALVEDQSSFESSVVVDATYSDTNFEPYVPSLPTTPVPSDLPLKKDTEISKPNFKNVTESMIPTRKDRHLSNLPPSLRPKKPVDLPLHQPQVVYRNRHSYQETVTSPNAASDRPNSKRLSDLIFKETIFVPISANPGSPSSSKYKHDSTFKESIFVSSPEQNVPSPSKIPTFKKETITVSPSTKYHKETIFISKQPESASNKPPLSRSEVKVSINKYSSAIPQAISISNRTSWTDSYKKGVTSYEPVYTNVNFASKTSAIKATIVKKPLPAPRSSSFRSNEHLLAAGSPVKFQNDVSDNMTDSDGRNSREITGSNEINSPCDEPFIGEATGIPEQKNNFLSQEAILVEESKAHTDISKKEAPILLTDIGKNEAEIKMSDQLPSEQPEGDSDGAFAIDTKAEELNIGQPQSVVLVEDDVEEIPRGPSVIEPSNVNLFHMDSHSSSYDSYLELFKSKESKEFDDIQGKKPLTKGFFGVGGFAYVEEIGRDDSSTNSTIDDDAFKKGSPKIVDFVPLDDKTTPVFTKPESSYDTLEREKTFHVLGQAAKLSESTEKIDKEPEVKIEKKLEEIKELDKPQLDGSLEILARKSSSFSKSSSKSQTSTSRTSFTQAKKLFEALAEANKEERPKSAISSKTTSRLSARDSRSFEHVKSRGNVNKEAGYIPKPTGNEKK